MLAYSGGEIHQDNVIYLEMLCRENSQAGDDIFCDVHKDFNNAGMLWGVEMAHKDAISQEFVEGTPPSYTLWVWIQLG